MFPSISFVISILSTFCLGFFLWLYLSLSLLQYWCGFSLFPIVWIFILSFFLHKPFRNLNLFLLCLFFHTRSLSLCSCSFSPHLWLSLCLSVPPVQGARPRTRRVARMCSQMGSNPLGCWSTSGFKSNCLIRAPSQPFCHGSVRGHKAKVKRWTILLKK